VPKNVKEVRSFLGLASFYRRLDPKFAEFSKALTQLIRKDVQFKWKGSQHAAFEKLKEIRSEQGLAYPDFNLQFILTTRIQGGSSRSLVAGLRLRRAPDRICQ
jgi:hypothetical protein